MKREGYVTSNMAVRLRYLVDRVTCMTNMTRQSSSDAVFDAMFDKVVDEIAAELNITYQPDVCEEKGDDLKESLIEQVGNVHQGLAAILKFLS